eukprot:COSAG01_NODE_17134_length_1175_cov_1.888476_1_plen_82_part_01
MRALRSLSYTRANLGARSGTSHLQQATHTLLLQLVVRGAGGPYYGTWFQAAFPSPPHYRPQVSRGCGGVRGAGGRTSGLLLL